MSAQQLYYKTDWDECKGWMAAWLTREPADHWALGVLAPRDEPLPFPPPAPLPGDPHEQWLDIDAAWQRAEASFARMFYGGIFHPYIYPNLGPGSLSLFLGVTPLFMPDTVWHEPLDIDPATVDLKFDANNPYWQWTVKALQRYQVLADGKCLVAMPDLLDGLDVLAQLFGTEALLIHLIDCPDEIHRLLQQVEDIFSLLFTECHKRVADTAGGNAAPHYQIWGPGRTLVTQCDFSTMISPDMFAEFVIPYLQRRCASMRYSIYHLDGPGAIKHLPQLLAVRELTAVEWTPGAGQPYAADPAWWDTIWKPVYAADKSAHVWAVPTELIEPFVREFGVRGTLMTTGCDSETDARALIERSRQWG